MSKYTTELRFICEHDAGLYESKGYNNVNEILEACHSNVFDFDYPIFDEEYRSVLEIKILKHYYTREICAETVGLWKLFLDARMNEIMPYYNKLYESELIQFNPLYDTDYSRIMDREGSELESKNKNATDAHTGTISDSGTNANTRTNNLTETRNLTKTNNLSESSTDSGSDGKSSTSADKNDHWDYYSDTPQGAVTNLANLTYLTNARHITDDGTGSTASETLTYGKRNTTTNTGTVGDTGTVTNTGTVGDSGTTSNTRTFNDTDTIAQTGQKAVNTTDDYVEHVVGKMPGQSMAKMVLEFRNTFLNIDKMIIEELADLFMGLW